MADLDLMEALFEGLPESPFFVKDASLRYVAANSAMAKLCGVRRASDLYGASAGRFFTATLARRYEAMDRLVLDQGRPVANRLDLAASRSAASAWLLFSRWPVRALNGDIVGVAANSRRLKPNGPADATYERLSAVVRQIEADYHKPLRLGALSDLAGMSKSQIERGFKLLFNMSLREFLQKTRIERAMTLLEGELTIAQIAYECGYTDQSAFSRSFKAVAGLSPRPTAPGWRSEPPPEHARVRTP